MGLGFLYAGLQPDGGYDWVMLLGLRSQRSWIVAIVVMIAIGILSRVVHTGFSVFDKYLGDALYAAMVYAIFRVFWKSAAVAIPALVVMTAIEFFQLTGIPARLLASEHFVVRIGARLLGTEFSFLDLAAYGVGIACIYLVDDSRR